MHIPRPFVHKRNVLCNETDTFKALKNRTSRNAIIPKSGDNNTMREVFMIPRCGGILRMLWLNIINIVGAENTFRGYI